MSRAQPHEARSFDVCTGVRTTLRWRQMDSNLQYRAVKGKFVPSASGSGWLQSRMWAAKITVLRHIPDVPGLGLEWGEKAVAAHLAANF